jgi:hypothetical protein
MAAISSCFLSICCASQDVLDDDDPPWAEPCPLGIAFLAPAPDAEVAFDSARTMYFPARATLEPVGRDYQVLRSGCASVVNTTSRATASSGAKIRYRYFSVSARK